MSRQGNSSSFGFGAPVTSNKNKPQPVAENKVTAPTEVPAFSDVPENMKVRLEQFRASLKRRGARGISGLARKFNIMDDSGDGMIQLSEFKKACREHTLGWSDQEVSDFFDFFDKDKSGGISYDEFLHGVRGELNDRRAQLVLLAFDVLDKDKSGVIEFTDIMGVYDASKHPDVIAGKRSQSDVLREFLDTFDCGEKDGKVFPVEFLRYYSNVSASIDDDDYFELMIRNAWHISGGTGQFANTTCRRVLVTHEDGSQTVEEIKNDIGISSENKEAMKANLKAQGITATSIDTKGSTDQPTPVQQQPPAQTQAKKTAYKPVTPW